MLEGSALLAEAVAAVDGTIAAGLEGEIGLLAARRAGGHEDLARPFAEAAGPAGTGGAFPRRTEAARGTGPAAAIIVPHPRDLATDHASFGLVAQPQLRVMVLLLWGE